MKQVFTLMVLAIIVQAGAWAVAPTVSNVTASQQTNGSKMVDIRYDVATPDSASLSISIMISNDGGSTYTIYPSHVIGDVGANIARGTGKHIVWDAVTDLGAGKYSANYKVCVTARDIVPGEMIYIPAGSFLMGNSGIGNDAIYSSSEEFPQHSVALSGYYIGKYEVTRGEYRAFMNAGGYSTQSYWSSEGWDWKVSHSRTEPYYWAASQNWGTGTFTQTDSHPVVGVTYYESEAYCAWAGGRLPTEAEWEKAARWTGSHPNVYPWGDTWDQEKCNNHYDSNPAGGGYQKYQTSPVGSYPSGASPYGCQDMAGNVWEWCADWYKSYPGSSNPFDDTNSCRVLRGGSWYGFDVSYLSRCAYRDYGGPVGGWYDIGFRLARSAP